MIKNKYITAVLLAASVFTSSAFALEEGPKLYVGAEFLNSSITTETISVNANGFRYNIQSTDNQLGAAFVFGNQLSQNLGIELGYTYLGKHDLSFGSNQKITLRHTNVSADVLGYLPVANEVEVIGSLGVGYLTSTIENAYIASTGKTHESRLSPRLGLGIQSRFDNITLRGMLRYQNGNYFIKNVTSLGLGALYHF